MHASKTVLALCVNWNGQGVLGPTMAALLRSRWQALEILVIDNGSTDASLLEVPSEVACLRLPGNLGYAAALNAALRKFFGDSSSEPQPCPDYFLILNNDLLVAPDLVDLLVEFADRHAPCVVGPRVVRFESPGKLEAAWGGINWSHVLCRYFGKSAPKDELPWIEGRRVDLLLGSVLLIDREVFRKVGLFDEAYFMYHEEVDFLYRCHLAGIEVFYHPLAEATHHVGHSTGEKSPEKLYWTRRNTVLFMRKHGARSWHWAFYFLSLAGSLLLNLVTGKWFRVRVILKAVSSGLRGESGPKQSWKAGG